MRYLLVTHIPFAQDAQNTVFLDRLWYEDLIGLTESIGPVTIAGPCMGLDAMRAWGTGFAEVAEGGPLRFVGLPVRKGRLDLLHRSKLRKVLRGAVENADLVHTSNLFGNDVALYFAHDLAVKRGKKTLFVVAEDFKDMLGWEWVRTEESAVRRWRRVRTLRSLDLAVRKRVRNSSLTFLHTPAAVSRYRLDAMNAFAIRQPVHELADVVSEDALSARQADLLGGVTLQIATASRMQALKGLDLLIRAISLMRDRGVVTRLTLYGGGPQQRELEKLVQVHGIEGWVNFAGAFPPGPALREALNRSHVFVMPHLTTDFGRGFFDGLAAGLPVVAFRSPASESTVRDGVDGVLVPNADVEALATALARLDADRSGLYGMAVEARQRALQNTRSEWNRLRSGWVKDLFAEPVDALVKDASKAEVLAR